MTEIDIKILTAIQQVECGVRIRDIAAFFGLSTGVLKQSLNTLEHLDMIKQEGEKWVQK